MASLRQFVEQVVAVSDREDGSAVVWSATGADRRQVVMLLAGAAGTIAATAALACGSVLSWRRLSGAAAASVDPAVLLAVTAAGIVLIAMADAAVRAGGPLVAAAAARVGLALAVAALALPPRTATWLDIATSGAAVLAAIVAVARWPGSPVAAGLGHHPAAIRVRPGLPAAAVPAPVGRRRIRRAAAPGQLRQRIERYELPAGGDCLRGRINLAIAAGARTASGHVGFCPAFSEMPTVQVTTDYDGVEATVSAAEVLPWGVRVECRLAEPAEEAIEIPIDLRVQAPG